MIVIIGGGPTGLYTALQLRKKGIKDIIIFDPRAGQYIRPAPISNAVFLKISREFGIDSKPDQFTIKGLERLLYAEAKKLKIRVENKHFFRLHKDKKSPGVIVKEDLTDEREEFVPAGYVFDCTGSKRAVVMYVNNQCQDSPFKIHRIGKLPIPNTLYANVQMEPSQIDEIKSKVKFNHLSVKDPNLEPLMYANSLIKLRGLGWREFEYPRVQIVHQGKCKINLYMECPAELSKDNYDEWLQAVLGGYVSSPNYSQIKSTKYKSKPRFGSFTVSPKFLEKSCYLGGDFPMVTALGDCQIDPYFRLGHGISNGFTRIDIMIEEMQIIDGKIGSFFAEEYQEKILPHLMSHKEQIVKTIAEEKESLLDALEEAYLKLKKALSAVDNPLDIAIYSNILKEIEIRKNYEKDQIVISQFEHEHEHEHELEGDVETVLTESMDSAEIVTTLNQELLPCAEILKLIGVFKLNLKNEQTTHPLALDGDVCQV